MGSLAKIWGWDTANWKKIIVDADGHLQVDVLGAGATESHIYGYNGATWNELLVESAGNPNLRVSLYHGTNQITSVATPDDIADTSRGLLAQAGVRGADGNFWKSINAEDNVGDDLTNDRVSLATLSKLYGWDGSDWDRLRTTTPADAFTTPTFALQVASFLMGYDGGDWNMVRVDAAGHIQIDVLSSVLPTGAPNYGQANIRNQLLSLSYTVLNTRLPSALDTDSLKVIEQGTPSVHLYGYDGTNWQTLLVESNTLKNLRVRLYAGADAIVADELDSVIVSSGSLGILTRSQIVGYNLEPMHQRRSDADALAAVARELCQFTISALYGYNGSTWDRIRTESSTAFNLRVKLYDGANGIDSSVLETNLTTQRGLVTRAIVVGRVAANDFRDVEARYTSGDSEAAARIALATMAKLYGYDGGNWDRLRTYGTGILKVGRAEVGLSDLRRTDAGTVKGSAGKLYWITMNPSAAASIIQLSDDLDGSGAVKWDMTHGVNAAHHMNFDPPLEFATGIYLKTLTNFTSVIFGYL